MRVLNKGRLFAAITVAAILLFVLIASLFHDVPTTESVKISLTGLTNGGSRPFVMLTLSNQDSVPIRNRGYDSQVEGNGNLLAPTMSFSLPHLTMTQLNAGDKVVFAVGQPNDGERWRVMFMYERKGRKEQLKDFLWANRKAFPLSMFKIQQPKMVIQTNYSEWFEFRPWIKTN